MNDNEKLELNDKRDIVIQAGIQAIPWVGSSLATLYFTTKQEKRFKRLENFYNEFSEEMKSLKKSFVKIEEHNKEELASILEKFHEEVEREHVKEKIKYLKNYLKNTLINPIKGNYDERKFFLDSLSALSLSDCKLLASLYYQEKEIKVGSINKPGFDQYYIVGSINRLRNLGFLILGQGNFTVGGGKDNLLDQIVKISDFGRKFCEFSINN